MEVDQKMCTILSSKIRITVSNVGGVHSIIMISAGASVGPAVAARISFRFGQAILFAAASAPIKLLQFAIAKISTSMKRTANASVWMLSVLLIYSRTPKAANADAKQMNAQLGRPGTTPNGHAWKKSVNWWLFANQEKCGTNKVVSASTRLNWIARLVWSMIKEVVRACRWIHNKIIIEVDNLLAISLNLD